MFVVQLYIYLSLEYAIQATDKMILTGPTGAVQLYSLAQGVYLPGAGYITFLILYPSLENSTTGIAMFHIYFTSYVSRALK